MASFLVPPVETPGGSFTFVFPRAVFVLSGRDLGDRHLSYHPSQFV